MYGIGSLWYGAFATAVATFVGHYPVRELLISTKLRPEPIELISVVWNVQLPQKSKTFTVHTALESNITELLSGSPTRRPRFAKLSPTSLHRLRGLRRFRHGIEFRPSRQDLPPSERNPHWIYRRCQSCYRCGWLVGIIWERIGHKVDREWITGDYV